MAVVLLLSMFELKAQNEWRLTIPGGSSAVPPTQQQLIWQEPGADCVNYRNEGTVGLRVDHDHADHFAARDYEVQVTIVPLRYGDYEHPYDNPDSPVSIPIVLHVSHRPDADMTPIPGRDICNDQDVYRLAEVHGFTMSLTGVEEIDLNGTVTPLNDLPPHIFIEGILYHDHHCAMDLGLAPSLTAVAMRECVNNDPFELQLNWSHVPNADEYEVEWTYVDDYAYDAGTNTLGQVMASSDLNYDLGKNATRIVTRWDLETTDQEYTIPLVFDRGWVVYRVRGVSRDPQFPTRKVFGAWSLPETVGEVGDAEADDHAVQIPGHDAQKPWSYSATYAEEGRRKEVVNYADGTQRPRQTVTRSNTDGIAVVGNTVYDRHGRAAITTLPTPIVMDQCGQPVNATPLKHYAGMLEVGQGDLFDWRDFDKDGAGGVCDPLPAPPLTGLVDYYYSQQYAADASDPQLLKEPNPFIPNSEGYAYQQVEFTPDASGRVRRQGGPGLPFQLAPGDHVTSYLYGKPDQPSLDRLFGTEAGYSGHYQKVSTSDANGQVSHTYLDISGRTVATSISGHAPDNLQALSTPGSLVTNTVEMMPADQQGKVLGNEVDLGAREVRFNTTFTVPREDVYQFNYDVLVLPQVPFSCDLLSVGCFDCVYDLEIKIVDQCQAPVWAHQVMVGDFNVIDQTLNFACQNVDPAQVSATVTLAPGEYSITRTFKLRDDARQLYLDQVIATCVTPEDDLINTYQSEVDATDCNIDCDDCLLALGTLEEFISAGLGNEADYEKARQECSEPCEVITWCRTAGETMARDMSPDGQYGRVRDDQGNFLVFNWDRASVFNENGLLLRSRYDLGGGLWSAPVDQWDPPPGGSSNPDWRHPYLYADGLFVEGYFELDGTRSLIEVSFTSGQPQSDPEVQDVGDLLQINGAWYTYPEDLLNLEDLVDVWREPWGRSLLYLHPEFCYYKHCLGYDVKVQPTDIRTSDDFDAWLLGIETFEEASLAGLFNAQPISPPQHPNVYYTADWFNPLVAVHDPYVVHEMDGTTAAQSMVQGWEEALDLTPLGSPSWHDMVEYASYRTRCGGQFGYVTGMVNSLGQSIDCFGFGSVIPGVPQQVMDQILDEEWLTLRSMYLELKYRVQKRSMDAEAATCDECAGINYCINKNTYVPYYFGIPAEPCQPCRSNYRYSFMGKDPRFPDPGVMALSAPNANAAGYQIYLMTGLCPAASTFEALLNDLAASGNLLATDHPIDGDAAFIGLYSVLTDLEHPGPTPACTMNPSPGAVIGANTLSIPIGCPDADWDCSIQLTCSACTTAVDWALINRFAGLKDVQPDLNGPPGASTFTIYAQVGTELIELTGSTCWDIANCMFEDVCEPNAVARTVADMLAAAADLGDISLLNTTIAFNDPIYGPLISPAFQELIDPNGTLGHVKVEWVASPKAIFFFSGSDGSTVLGPTLAIDIDESDDPDFVITNNTDWQTVTSVREFRNSHQNTFHMEVWDANDVRLATLSGKALLQLPGANEWIPVPLGSCGPPNNPYCQSNDQLITTALYAVLTERLQHYWGTAVLGPSTPDGQIPFDLFSSPLMTPLLESYLAQLLNLSPDSGTGNLTTTGDYAAAFLGATASVGIGPLSIKWLAEPSFPDIQQVTGPTYPTIPDSGPYYTIYAVADLDDGMGGTTPLQIELGGAAFLPCSECEPGAPTATGAQGSTGPNDDCDPNSQPAWAFTSVPDAYCANSWPRWTGYDLDGTPTGDPDMVTLINNNWTWFQNNSFELPLVLTYFPTYQDLESSGMCSCVVSYYEDYIQYTYGPVTALPGDPMPFDEVPPLTLWDYCALLEGGCIDNYNAYLEAVDEYNGMVVSPVQPLSYMACSEFTAQGYCHCVPEFVATLNMVMNDGEVFEEELVGLNLYDLAAFCAMPVPCAPDPPFVIPAIPEPVGDPCVDDLNVNAAFNGMVDHDHQIDAITTDFHNTYDNACLNGVHDLLQRINDDISNAEEQFTLYYYDRAGNLTRTVPPEGVEPLTTTQLSTVETDRSNGTRNTLNTHRMASDQRYNSLGQLTRSSMPDRDNMSIFETNTTIGLPAHLKVHSLQFVNTNLGYLTGYYSGPGGLERGLLYQTTNGGSSWTRKEDLIASDLRDVHFPDEVTGLTGWAVGGDGVVLKTVDGGTSWDLQGPTTQAYYQQLNALWFRTTQEGLMGGEGQRLHYTVNGGTDYSNYTLSLGIDRITDIGFDAHFTNATDDRYWATATTDNGTLGALISNPSGTLTTLGAWTKIDEVTSTLDHNCLSNVSASIAFAGGAEGLLYKTTDGGQNWSMVNTGTLLTFTDIEFLDAQVGIALLNDPLVAPDDNVLYATADGGLTWTMQGDLPITFQSLRTYATSGGVLRAYGQRPSGAVAVLALGSGQDQVYVSDIATPVPEPSAFWVGNYPTGDPDNPDGLIFCVTSGTTLYVRTDAFSEDQPWLSQQVVDTDNILSPFTKGVEIEAKVFTSPLKVVGFIRGGHGEMVPFKFDVTASPSILIPAQDYVPTQVVRLEPDASSPAGLFAVTWNSGTFAVALDRYTLDQTVFPPVAAGLAPVALSAPDGITDAMVTTINNGGITQTVTLAGEKGFLSQCYNLTGAPYSQQNVADDVRPLPLHAIAVDPAGTIAAGGEKGLIIKRDYNSSVFKVVGFRQTGTIHGAVYEGGVNWFQMCGDEGRLHRISTLINTTTTFSYKTAFSGNYLSLVAYGGNIYYAADNGSLVRTTNSGTSLVERPYVMGALRGLATRKVSGNVVETVGVGDAGHVHRIADNMRVRVREIYMPRLRDVHFKDELNGTVIGDKFALRYTTDGGVHWLVARRPSVGTGITQNKVITTAPGVATTFGANGSVGQVVRYVNGTGSIYAGLTPLSPVYDIAQGADGLVYGTHHNGSGTGLTLVYNPNVAMNLSIRRPFAAVYLGFTKAIWAFKGATPGILIAGDPTRTKLCTPIPWGTNVNATGTVDPVTMTNIPVTEVIADLHFIDDQNGFAITTTGRLFRTANGNATHTAFTWTELTGSPTPPAPRILDNLDQQTVASKYKVRAIAFNTRTRGFIGGEYTAPPAGVPARYARTVNDETGLYSQRMWYDAVGRLVLSQSTKQQKEYTGSGVNQRFSYTLYDELGRVTEAGEVEEKTAGTVYYRDVFGAYIGDQWEPRLVNNDKLALFVAANKRYERIRTWYDGNPFASAIIGVLEPENLDRRVAATAIYDVFDPTAEQDDDFDQASHYSYDIHGNVKELVQDIPELATLSGDADQRYKLIRYDYDLISGNVKRVDYQPGAPDQYHHKYTYDADNRIQEVHTSRNGDYWERDARYFYYAHGPLARTELGENEVQGLDYAYTLQGWLKSMNADALDPLRDMGQDGLDATVAAGNNSFGRDAYGFSLGYYEGDYTPIDGARWGSSTSRPIASTVGSFADAGVRKDLFNGNIAHTVSALPVANAVAPLEYDDGPLATVYRYDQLNRLKSNVAYADHTSGQFQWAATNAVPGRHASTFTYDRNGNITALTRNRGDGSTYDALSYNYHKSTGGKTLQNRLCHWDDAQADASRMSPAVHGSEDLERNNQPFVDNTAVAVVNNPGSNNHNYYYDSNGNLKKDRTAQIDNITWTPRGKVGAVTRSGGTLADLVFTYDASGQRRGKYVDSDADNAVDSYEHYVRDPQGNVMAMYTSTVDDVLSTVTYRLTERPRYGSSRLGNDDLALDPLTARANPAPHLPGRMRYELNDHLGNVHATVSDRKLSYNTIPDPAIEYYGADLLSAMDYEPFGSLLPGRNFSSDSYRFSFQGQEKDDDLQGGAGTSYNYAYRMHDSRVGRFLSIDPLVAKYPYWTPYAFCGNMLIQYRELEGLEPDFDGTEDGQYAIAKSRSEDHYYGYTWNKTNSQWVMGSSTEYVVGDLNAGDGDLLRTPLPGVVGDNESEKSARADFVNSFKSGTMLEHTLDDDVLLNHFLVGDGSELHFMTNTGMSRIISNNDHLTLFMNAFADVAFNYYQEHGNLEGFDGVREVQNRRPGYMDGNLFSWTVMGGYQKMTVRITSASDVQVTMLVTIGDIFGAGAHDANSSLPGLSDLYNLQHNYSAPGKYTPFPWEVDVNNVYYPPAVRQKWPAYRTH